MFAICRTEGCLNEGEAVAVNGDLPVACGPCGQLITDLTDTPPELPTEVPPWLE